MTYEILFNLGYKDCAVRQYSGNRGSNPEEASIILFHLFLTNVCAGKS